MAIDEALIEQVWRKGVVVPNNDPSEWRKDQCGAWMYRKAYGNRSSQYGWEVDHISPGGPDQLSNLRPLQWQNNVDKSDGRLACNFTASGPNNVDKRLPPIARAPQ